MVARTTTGNLRAFYITDRGIAMFLPPTGALYGLAEYKKKD